MEPSSVGHIRPEVPTSPVDVPQAKAMQPEEAYNRMARLGEICTGGKTVKPEMIKDHIAATNSLQVGGPLFNRIFGSHSSSQENPANLEKWNRLIHDKEFQGLFKQMVPERNALSQLLRLKAQSMTTSKGGRYKLISQDDVNTFIKDRPANISFEQFRQDWQSTFGRPKFVTAAQMKEQMQNAYDTFKQIKALDAAEQKKAAEAKGEAESAAAQSEPPPA